MIDLGYLKTIESFEDAKVYLMGYMVPLCDGTHAVKVNNVWTICTKDVVKSVYFNRLPEALFNYYFYETDVKVPIYDATKPRLYENYFNFDGVDYVIPKHGAFINTYLKRNEGLNNIKPKSLHLLYNEYAGNNDMGKDALIKVFAECGITPVKCSTILYKISYTELYDIAVINGWVTKDAKDAVIDSLNARLNKMEATITDMNTSITAMQTTIQGYEETIKEMDATIKLYEDAETDDDSETEESDSDYSDSEESEESEDSDDCNTQADLPPPPPEKVNKSHPTGNETEYYDEYYWNDYYGFALEPLEPDETPDYIEEAEDEVNDYRDVTPEYYVDDADSDEEDADSDDDDIDEEEGHEMTLLDILKRKA